MAQVARGTRWSPSRWTIRASTISPTPGWVELEDAETGQRLLVDTSHGPTRTRIRCRAEKLQQERSRKLVQAGVDRVALQTTVPYGAPLRRAFAERARRLSR